MKQVTVAPAGAAGSDCDSAVARLPASFDFESEAELRVVPHQEFA